MTARAAIRRLTIRAAIDRHKAFADGYHHHPTFSCRSYARSILAAMPEQRQFDRVCNFGPVPRWSDWVGIAGAAPVLTPEQSFHLFRRFNYRKHRIATRLPEPAAALADLCDVERLDQADKVAAEADMRTIATANMQLLVKALNFDAATKAGQEKDELLAEGQLALLNCIRLFNPFCGVRFSTYLFHSIKRVQVKAATSHARTTTIDDDMPALAADGDDANHNDEIRNAVRQALDVLDLREREIVGLRFGLFGEAMSMPDIGVKFGITKQAVRKVERKALEKMRRLMVSADGC